MIYTKISEAQKYLGMDENLDKAIHFLMSDAYRAHSSRECSKMEIDGKDVTFSCFEIETVPPSESCTEGHAYYADMHIILSGAETIGISDLDQMSLLSSDAVHDISLYQGKIQNWITLTTGEMLIVFPGELHMPRVIAGNVNHAKKSVIKFRVSKKEIQDNE